MNQNNNIIPQWANAHVFYNMYLHKSTQNDSKIESDEYLWRQKIVTEAPNGRLITQNSFFENLKQSNKIYLAHSTYNLNEILKNGKIFSSGGCLAGSIYCTPLLVESTKLRMHNLGAYVLETEAPMLAGQREKRPEILIFEIETNQNAHHNLIGIDYLRMGEVHYSIYKQLEYLLSYEERNELHKKIMSNMKHSLDYLSLCNESPKPDESLDPDYFLNIFVGNIQFLPILGYLYFETVSEYLMLFQDNDEAKKYSEVGEFYNPTYKKLMYALEPRLKQNFKLSGFQPSINELIKYLEDKKIFTKFNYAHFKDWLAKRLLYLSNARLFDKNKQNNVEWRKFHWDFDNLTKFAKPLLGHLIHRELRNFGRYPSFYFYFDQTKALQVWNYWNHMDIEIPFNGVIPKGEIGINPALPNLTYKIFLGKQIRNKSGFRYLEQTKELKISIEPKLVDLRYSCMHCNNGEKIFVSSDVD